MKTIGVFLFGLVLAAVLVQSRAQAGPDKVNILPPDFDRAFELIKKKSLDLHLVFPPRHGASVKMTEEQGTHSFLGLLRIAEMGCDGYCYLVVSGEERGAIWTDWEDIWLSPEPRRAPSSLALIPPQVWNCLDGQHNAHFVDYLLSPAYPHRLTFFQWYEDWLDKQLG